MENTFSFAQAIDIKINYIMLIGEYPCKIVDRSKSKTGKHGGYKISFIGIDIFTNNKHCTIQKSNDKVKVPIIIREQYKIVDMEENNDDGNTVYILHLISNKGILREHLKITNGDQDIIDQIYNTFMDDHDIDVVILEYLNSTMIVSYKIEK